MEKITPEARRGERGNVEGRLERAKDIGEFMSAMHEYLQSDEFLTSKTGFTEIERMVERGLERFGSHAFYDAFSLQFPDIVDDFLLPPKE